MYSKGQPTKSSMKRNAPEQRTLFDLLAPIAPRLEVVGSSATGLATGLATTSDEITMLQVPLTMTMFLGWTLHQQAHQSQS